MLINTYQAGPLDTNNYLVIDKHSKEAMLIDCSGYKPEIIQDVNSMGLNVKYIFCLQIDFNQFAKQFAQEVESIPKYDKTYAPGIVFKIGNLEFNVIKTAGHTEGGACIYGNGVLFSGDTLFCNSFGRTDLYSGNFQKLKHSILNVLFYLPDETKVYPGHDIATTIGAEKAHNEINKYR